MGLWAGAIASAARTSATSDPERTSRRKRRRKAEWFSATRNPQKTAVLCPKFYIEAEK